MKYLTKTRAIASYCRECSGGQQGAATLCVLADCPLWPYRIGPNKKRYTEQVKAAWEKLSDREKKELAEYPLTLDSFLSIVKCKGVFRETNGRTVNPTWLHKKEE